MPAAPLPSNEAQRLAALIQCGVLDTEAEPAFDDLTKLAARLCGTPIALVSLLDASRQWFKSRVGLDACQTPREQAFCGYAILKDEPLIITDAAQDERTCDNPLVTSEPGIRFYAGIPLLLSTGEALGTLCVIDLAPRQITVRQIEDLKALALQAAGQLELRIKLRQIEDANRALKEANQAKSAFLANMSHEIRTPMTAILGFTDVLVESTTATNGNDGQEPQAALQTIKRNGQHLLTLINDILDISKIESGSLSIEQIATDSRKLLRDIQDLLCEKANAKQLALTIDVSDNVPSSLMTDPTRLQQIVTNLVSNAIKFTDEGSITISADYDKPTCRLTVRVKDTGIGMTTDQLQRIRKFEAFQQADVSTTRKFGGTGLGLRISKQLAELLGGDLTVESKEGAGSTFALTIRAEACVDDCPAKSPAPRTKPSDNNCSPVAPDDAPLKGCTILLAEDGPDNQRLFRFLLTKAGAEVCIAEDGQQAVDQVNENCDKAVDLILMDVQMPNLDGVEATKCLRNHGIQTPIVALTAHALEGERQKCLAAGFDDFLSKPVERAALIATCIKWARQTAASQ